MWQGGHASTVLPVRDGRKGGLKYGEASGSSGRWPHRAERGRNRDNGPRWGVFYAPSMWLNSPVCYRMHTTSWVPGFLPDLSTSRDNTEWDSALTVAGPT